MKSVPLRDSRKGGVVQKRKKMKKLFYTAVIALLGMTACQKAEAPDASSGEVQIQIATTLPTQMQQTRAAGDGTQVDRCIMEIYLDGKLYGERQTAAVTGLTANFSVRLVAGKSYDFVFWADKSGGDLNTDLHYNTANLQQVSIADMDSYTGNDDTRDAFYAVKEVVADQTKAVTVELKRPFGQLNVKTLDMAEVAAAAPALVPAKVKIAFTSVPTTINLLTGELTDTKSAVTYAEAVAPANNAGNVGELTVDYIFAPYTEGEQQLVDFTMSFLDDTDAEVATAYAFTSIPMQRNYRTMVSGNLLTRKAEISVEVKPAFEPDDIVVVTSSEMMMDVINAGGSVKLANDITLTSFKVDDAQDVTIDLNQNKLIFNEPAAVNATGASIEITNGDVEAMNMKNPVLSLFNTNDNGIITLDGVHLKTDGSGVGPSMKTNGGTIIVRNSTLECGAYAVSTNASAPVSQDVKFILENSTFIGNTPLCINIPCTLTMDGCTVTGDTQGMMLRGGTATIRNSTLTLDITGEYQSEADAKSIADYFNARNWGSGNMVNCAALTVGNKAENAYQYPTVLTLENTKLEVKGEYASLFPSLYAYANQGEGLGVTIGYDDQCTFTNDCTYGSKNITVNGEAQ